MSYPIERNLKCPFCNTLIINKFQFDQQGCSYKECKSHLFVIGNKVDFQRRPELGAGTIIDINPYLMKEKKLSKRKLTDINDENKFNSDELIPNKLNEPLTNQVFKFFINFPAYIDESVFQVDIRHHLFKLNSKIRYNKQVGIILNVNLHHKSGLIHYEILNSDGKKEFIDESQIKSQVFSPIDEYFKGNISSSEKFVLKLWGTQLVNLYNSNLVKIITHSRLSLLPHQISVAHHLLETGQARYILADEVGLGKTIEAGIYIKEMIARNLASRVLIITPATITGQWEFELQNKFNLHFTRLTAKQMKEIKVNFRSGNFRNIKTNEDIKLCTATLQYARLSKCASMLNMIEWDIVIFDEAHHLRRYLTNQKTEQYRTTLAYELAQNLSQKTKSLLLLTATPIQLHSFDLFSLIQLLNPFEFPNFDSFESARLQIPLLNLVVKNLRNFKKINSFERNALVYQILNFDNTYSETELEERVKFQHHREEIISKIEEQHFLSRYVIRNRRRIVFPENEIKRIPRIIDVELSKEELETYNKIHQYLAKIYSQNFESGPSGMGFVMVILQKLLTSSVPAILKSMKKRITYLEDNKEMILKLGAETEELREFTDEEASSDAAWGLEDLDLEDRLIVQNRKRKMTEKKGPTLDINAHIKILKEFVKDLEDLKTDSKADMLIYIVKDILTINPHEKIIIFTQFKQTLFYLQKLIEKENFQVAPFHGDLSEVQKQRSVSDFRHQIPILLSTEIGGEGRNFQFCHIIINYDLPWNPMRLEQRIGRLDRIGQTDNVLIYNFYIRDTVESSIITAISERIHLFEESIGALEPILGSLEGQITDLILKDQEDPLKFRLDEVISKTSNKIDEVYDKLEDFILDKRSFQYDYLSKDLNRVDLITGIDIHAFIQLVFHYTQNQQNKQTLSTENLFETNLSQQSDDFGIWDLKFSEQFRQFLRISEQHNLGVFDIDLARTQEEVEFFSLGHPIIMKFAELVKKDDFEGLNSKIFVDFRKLINFFISPYGTKLQNEEIPIVKKILNNEVGLNLFIFEIKFLGIIVEKTTIPVLITDEMELLPTLSEFIYRPHNFSKVLEFSANIKEIKIQEQTLSRSNCDQSFKKAQQYTKQIISSKIEQLSLLNQQRYITEKEKTIKTAKYKKKFAEIQIKQLDMTLRAKKLKLPTDRQIINVNSLENEQRKKQRINQFKKIENEVKYYESELSRWQEILDSLDFDIPEQLKRLEKYRKLLINADFLSYARVLTF